MPMRPDPFLQILGFWRYMNPMRIQYEYGFLGFFRNSRRPAHSGVD